MTEAPTSLGRDAVQRRLLVCGGVLIDDLVFADGESLPGVLGGAGVYALAGAALWHEDVVLVSGVGEDADGHLLPWMKRSGLETSGLRIDGPFTPKNSLVYRADGTRSETPVFGPAHFERLQPSGLELAAAITPGDGLYIFRDDDPSFWSAVGEAARRNGARVLWEISADVCSPERLSTIGQAAAQVAALSINQEECAGLFGAWDKSVVIDGLRGLGAPIIFVRCGGDGSFVITPNAVVPIAAQPARIVDVTGAGNAYGGAALAGLLAGADSVEAAHMGAIASRFTLAQHGPFEPRDASVRARARAALLAVSSHPTHQQTLATQP